MSHAIRPERSVPLAGARNFRDLGGYETSSGRTIRWGVVYRSGRLSDLTRADLEVVSGLGIRSVVDLRRPREREQSPGPASGGRWRTCEVPLRKDEPTAGRGDAEAFVHVVLGGPIPGSRRVLSASSRAGLAAWAQRQAAEEWVTAHLELLAAGAGAIGAVVRLLSDGSALPAVIHCNAGKDRVGAVALVLSALGVADEDVVRDFALSNLDLGPEASALCDAPETAAPPTREDVLPLLGVVPAAMSTFLERLRAEHGGAAGYLLGHAGLSRQELDAFRDALLTG